MKKYSKAPKINLTKFYKFVKLYKVKKHKGTKIMFISSVMAMNMMRMCMHMCKFSRAEI